MKALIYITIFLMSGTWFTSCKASRNMETEKQIDYSGDFLYLRNLIESLRLDVNKQTKITTDKLSDLKIENTTVYLSPPDSTGKQYPVKESTTTASKQDQERVEVDETLSITLQQFSNRLDSLNSKVDAMLNQKETVGISCGSPFVCVMISIRIKIQPSNIFATGSNQFLPSVFLNYASRCTSEIIVMISYFCPSPGPCSSLSG